MERFRVRCTPSVATLGTVHQKWESLANDGKEAGNAFVNTVLQIQYAIIILLLVQILMVFRFEHTLKPLPESDLEDLLSLDSMLQEQGRVKKAELMAVLGKMVLCGDINIVMFSL